MSKFRPVYEDDISPSTSCCPRSSVDTFDSALASDEELSRDVDMDSAPDCSEIPPLPIYTHQVVDPNVRPSTPQDFAKLFPSRERLSIRHDDFTPDGNMNLRVDTVVPGRRRQTMQLFHLRMYDLGKRDFSLRRYCRGAEGQGRRRRLHARRADEGDCRLPDREDPGLTSSRYGLTTTRDAASAPGAPKSAAGVTVARAVQTVTGRPVVSSSSAG